MYVDYGLVCRPMVAVGSLPTHCGWGRGLGVKATVLRPGAEFSKVPRKILGKLLILLLLLLLLLHSFLLLR